MNPDPEMQLWQKLWTAEPNVNSADLAVLKQKTAKRAKRLRARYVAELSTATLFLVGSLVYALTDRTPEVMLWAACVWTTTIFTATFTVWNWRSLWKEPSQSISDYVALSSQCARATLRASYFGLGLLFVQTTISTTWFTLDLNHHRITAARYAAGLGFLFFLTAIFLWIFLFARKRAKNELEGISDE